MAVVCLPNCIFLSATSRMIAVFLELKKLGVPVIMATHGGPYTFVLDQHQIPYEIIGTENSEEFNTRYLQSIYDGGRTQNYTLDVLSEHVREEIAFFKQVNARIVITGFTLSARLSTTAVNIPLVVTHLGSMVPITFEKYGMSTSEFLKNAFTRFLPGQWLDTFGTWLFPRLKSYLKTFNAVSEEIDILPCRSLFDLILGDHTLITDTPEILEISVKEVAGWRPINTNMYRPSTQLAYSGPIYARLFGDVPEDVNAFLSTDKPKIFVAMNSGHLDDLNRVLDTIKQVDVVAVVVSTIHTKVRSESSNILIKAFLPSHKVMPLCDLAIMHGGQGSIQTAIASGIPVIGFPVQPEQNFNLRRVQHHGAGKCMALFDLRRGKLKAAIHEICSDPRYKQAAEKLQGWQSKRDGATLTARYIENLLSINPAYSRKNPV